MGKTQFSGGQYVLMILPAIVAGVLSGAISSWVFASKPIPQEIRKSATQEGQVISARELRLIDENGDECASLVARNGGSFLRLASAADKAGVSIDCSAGSAKLILSDEEGKECVTLRTHFYGHQSPEISVRYKDMAKASLNVVGRQPWLSLSGNQLGEPPDITEDREAFEQWLGKYSSVYLSIENGKNPQLIMSDKDGQERILLNLDERRGPSLSLYGKDHKAFVELNCILGPYLCMEDFTAGSSLLDNNGISLRDKNSNRAFEIGLRSEGEPYLELLDKSGQSRAVLGSTTTVTVKTGEEHRKSPSSLIFFDKDGKVMWQVP